MGRVEEKEGRVEVGKDGLRTQTGKFAVQTEVPPMRRILGIFVYLRFWSGGRGMDIAVWGRKLERLRYKRVGNRSSLLQKR